MDSCHESIDQRGRHLLIGAPEGKLLDRFVGQIGPGLAESFGQESRLRPPAQGIAAQKGPEAAG
ncbi:hypothetical protein D3C83_198550 [compost metagenome]